MQVIYPAEIQESIDKISKAGAKVTRKTHAIYARETVTFTNEHYPLEIIVTDKLPRDVVCMVAKKQRAYASQY